MFWRCVERFTHDPEKLLNTRIRLFWSMCRHLDRLNAQDDIRAFNIQMVVAAASNGDENTGSKFRQDLDRQMGLLVKQQERISAKEDILALMRA